MLDEEHARLYADVVYAALPTATRHHLEAVMTAGLYEPKSDFVRRITALGRSEGEAISEAHALLAFLNARGIDVPVAAEERINACTDRDQLERWIRRAATVNTVEELFA